MRSVARKSRWWVQFQDLRRVVGPRLAWDRWRLARKVLKTPPVRTDPVHPDGPPPDCEVHVLTWQRDYVNGLWAAKSFYRSAGVRWPLVWHETGVLSPKARRRLADHFPDARLLTAKEADDRVSRFLSERGLSHCLACRDKSFMLMKLIDCLALSRAKYLLLLDTDVLFFAPPRELLDAVRAGEPAALFNRDSKSWYNLTPAAARERYGVELVEQVNAGLALVRREDWRLDLIDRYLSDPDILSVPWLTEQTVQALMGSQLGMKFLPPTYLCSVEPGLETPDGVPLTAKHYPGYPRPHFYREGIPAVLRSGLLSRGASDA
jgi:hypothetical protein